jgi:uncharacterized protein
MNAPIVDEDSAPYWEGLAQRRIRAQICLACHEQRVPPMPSCPNCGSASFEWQDVNPAGTVYSWIVVRMPIGGLHEGDVPRVIATVALDGGGRVVGRITGDWTPGADRRVAAQFIEHASWTELAFVDAESPRE